MSEAKGPHAQTLVAPPDPPEAAGESQASSARTLASGAHGSAALPVPSSSRLDAYLGRVLDGRYAIEEPLGEGGMGFVYKGRHKVIDKRVAIKILRGDLAADQEMTDRFLNEARAASSIGNPHIVDISDFGKLDDGATYFVMEFLDGQSLGELMTQLRVVPILRLVHIAKQIARGLAAAHARGIVHRDLKPDNVMLVTRGDDRDFAKILDFGIAKVGGASGRLTKAGSVFGTPHYMSPEQAAGLPVDQRTDIYALGVILYEMASGKVPFDADNFMGILTQHMYKAPAPIRALVPQPQEVPPGLEAIVLKCLSKKSDLRYQTMDELVMDLERVEQGSVPSAVAEMMARSGGFNVPVDYFRNPQRAVPGGPAMMPARPQLPPKPRSLVVLVAIASVMVLLAVAGVVVFLGMRKSASAEPSITADAPSPSAIVAEDPAAAASGSAGSAGSAGTDPAGAGAASSAGAGATAGPEKVPVVVTVDPIDATVAVEGTDQSGVQPLTVGVPLGATVKIKVTRSGYKAQTLSLDGKKDRVPVRLERDAPKWTAPAKGTGKGTGGAAWSKPAPQPKGCPAGYHLDPWGSCLKEAL
jgi:serine/threonine-protein kinase